MAPTGVPYHVDWIWSNTSNVHVANHRDWFTDFTEFKSHTGTLYGGDRNPVEVLGVGNVKLDVQTDYSETGPASLRTIVLEDVVYSPSATCNILGSPVLKDYNLTTSSDRSQLFDKETGASAGILDNVKLFRLRLAGHSATETSLDPSSVYLINATWSQAERARWLATKDQKSTALPPLTEEENTWLKKHYGNEWKFLQSYGLNITKDDQRAEGRDILEAIMTEDDDDEEEGSISDGNDFLADIEADPSSHVADHMFPSDDLDWVEKHYRHTGNFMRRYGLKPWDDEDCEEAVQIAKSLQTLD